jgi:hypothetical protein
VSGKYRKFTPEFREEAARMVAGTSRPIADVARELGINETSLGNWVRAYREEHAGDEPPLQLSERALLAEEAGLAIGFHDQDTDAPVYLQIAQLCIKAGADTAVISRWIEEGKRRAAAARRQPFTG